MSTKLAWELNAGGFASDLPSNWNICSSTLVPKITKIVMGSERGVPKVVLVVSFLKEGNESCQSLRQVGLLHDRWRHHLSPSPHFRYGTGGEGNILQPPAPVDSAATAHKTFGPIDSSSTYSMCTRRMLGDIGHRTLALRSGVSNHQATHRPSY
ncbi:uncharacterized protein TNCV_346551 [Trichonephila clavipes]|nr:uncharacterized protein TNCV_346551 [Trichonephila clavipes]